MTRWVRFYNLFKVINPDDIKALYKLGWKLKIRFPTKMRKGKMIDFLKSIKVKSRIIDDALKSIKCLKKDDEEYLVDIYKLSGFDKDFITAIHRDISYAQCSNKMTLSWARTYLYEAIRFVQNVRETMAIRKVLLILGEDKKDLDNFITWRVDYK